MRCNRFILFNYYDGTSPLGTMDEEHYEALKSFWIEVVNNNEVIHDSIEANTVFVLPKNYGWGMRWSEDKIWGIFKPDFISQQIWESLEEILNMYKFEVDIIYTDENFPLFFNYENVYYWNNN